MYSERRDACTLAQHSANVQVETSSHFIQDTPCQMLEVSIVGCAHPIDEHGGSAGCQRHSAKASASCCMNRG